MGDELTLEMLPEGVRNYVDGQLSYHTWADMLANPAGRQVLDSAGADFDVSETDRRDYGRDGYWSEITVTVSGKEYTFEFSDMY
jgi:hypothetical protein